MYNEGMFVDNKTQTGAQSEYINAPQVKMSGIDREYSELTGNIERLDGLLCNLEGRLQTVLRNPEPMAEKGADRARSVPNCMLAESINRDSYRIENFANRIEDILRRLEL